MTHIVCKGYYHTNHSESLWVNCQRTIRKVICLYLKAANEARVMMYINMICIVWKWIISDLEKTLKNVSSKNPGLTDFSELIGLTLADHFQQECAVWKILSSIFNFWNKSLILDYN